MMKKRNTKTANDLIEGDIIASGEIVTKNAVKIGSNINKKAAVHLRNPKTGKHRVAFWGWYSSIFMKRVTV